MASSLGLFLGFITGCLLVNGCLCLQCYLCNEFSDFGCSNLNRTSCTRRDNICSAVSLSLKAGTKMESGTVKGCDIGFPINSVSEASDYGIQILIGKISCNSETCNEKAIDLSKGGPEEEDTATSGVECYSCFSTNKSKCAKQSAEKVKCPVGSDTCYEAAGNLTLGFFSVPVFVKQCSVPTNVTNIRIGGSGLSFFLNAVYCTGNLCNDLLIFSPETTKVPLTNSTTAVPATNKTTPTILPTTVKTTSGTGRTHPFSVAVVILVVMKSFL